VASSSSTDPTKDASPGRLASPELLQAVTDVVVGRQREVEVVLAALDAGRHVILEGPPGTGKSTVLRTLAAAAGLPFELVEGSSELTPAKLMGAHDPSQVLAGGWSEASFVDGPLVRALRSGGLLYVEELNRVPEDTLNLLIAVMSEGVLSVPRLGSVRAAPGFRVVAAMNPFDAIGTHRVPAAIADRCCRVVLGYQAADVEQAVVRRFASERSEAWLAACVELVRATRDHPDLRFGASVRGAIDLALVAGSLGAIRGADPESLPVTSDAAQAALSARVRVDERSLRRPEEIVAELVERYFGGSANPAADAGGRAEEGPGLTTVPSSPGKAPAPASAGAPRGY
jgi:MoxR-like ATPase